MKKITCLATVLICLWNTCLSQTGITGIATVCTGATTTLSDAVSGGSWTSTNTTIATVNHSTGLVKGVATGTATISYNATGVHVAKVVTVNGLPSAGTISGTATVCTAHTTSLTHSVSGGVWSSTAPSVATIGTTGIVYGVSTGTATISYTVTNGCGSRAVTKVITVNSLPTTGSITGSATLCAASSTTLSDGISGGTWSSTVTSVATVNTTGKVTGVAAGTSIISYRLTNTCGTAAATKTVTVTPLPSAGSISGTTTTCAGASTTLTASGNAGGVWSSTATSVATAGPTGMVTGVSAGTATIKYTVTNGCGSSVASKSVTVTALPVSGTISGAGSLCLPGNTTLTLSGGSGGVWSSTATTIATVNTSGKVTAVSAGIATIKYTVTNSCGAAAASKVMTVNTSPTAGSISGAAGICLPGTTSLTVTGGTSGGTWSSATAAVATVGPSGVVTGLTAGTSTIQYTVINGCGTATTTRIVTVTAAPVAGSISGIAIISVGGAGTALSDAVAGGVWSSGSTGIATVSSSGVVSAISAGTAAISYTVGNSCGSSTTFLVVTVNPMDTSGGSATVYGRIPIEAKRWYQLNNVSNGLEGLFDSVLDVSVLTGWGKILEHYDAYYPLLKGEVINIDSIKFYDGEGTNESDPFTLYYIDSLWNRIPIATFVGTRYNDWVGPDPASPDNYHLAVPAHNIRYLVINCSGSYPNEMALYGSYTAPDVIPVAPVKSIRLKQEFGVNGFEWDLEDPVDPSVIDESRMTAAKSFTAIRHYLDWEKLEPTEGGYTYNPAHDGSWNYDTMYARCKAEGIEVLADIKTQPDWMTNTYPHSKRDNENVPVEYGSDFSDPASYIKQAKVAFQFAARYGYNSLVSSSLLHVDTTIRWPFDPANVVKKGLGLIRYIECDNERDKWWKGRAGYQTGREYAANLSAFYDGNKNTMGSGVGVKNADSTMMVVMGGVASPVTDYFKGMVDWCKEFRGYKPDGSVDLCWDVINYHIYPNDGSRGVSPEAAHADSFALDFVNAAHLFAKDMPVWVTETGYDINQESDQRAIPIGSKTALQTQADWTLRNSLLYARCGIERTFFYEMYDDDTSNPTTYSSCGFINPDHSRKPQADYLYQANRLMGSYVYQETISTSPLVDRYELGGHSAYALVKPSENGSTTAYTLTLPGFSGDVHIYQPAIGQDSMSVTTVPAIGSVALTVTETPIFVIPGAVVAGRPAHETNTLTALLPSVMVYPNPTSGSINFSIENEKAGDVHITLYTETGVTEGNYLFKKQPGKFTQTIDISPLPCGVYFMEIVSGGERTIKKVLKVNQ